MVSGTRQILGLSTAVMGFLGSIVICALPVWKVQRTISGIAGRVLWEGLWMYCFGFSGQTLQCRVYSSQTVSTDLQAARALVIIAILFGMSGILLVVVGGTCTNCIKNEKQRCQVHIAAGVSFIIAGLLVLIPVCWTANAIVQRQQQIYDILYDLGYSLYVGWVAAGLLVLGGSLLCTCKKKRSFSEGVRFLSLKSECEE